MLGYKQIMVLIIGLIVLFRPAAGFGETIILKSGETVEGKIIKQTDDYIRIDFYGTALTYYLEDIASIDGELIIDAIFTNIPRDSLQQENPAVVQISVPTVIGEEFLGNGLIIDENGIVVTEHALAQSLNNAKVKLKDGRVYSAGEIILCDSKRNICLFKIDAEELPAIGFPLWR